MSRTPCNVCLKLQMKPQPNRISVAANQRRKNEKAKVDCHQCLSFVGIVIRDASFGAAGADAARRFTFT